MDQSTETFGNQKLRKGKEQVYNKYIGQYNSNLNRLQVTENTLPGVVRIFEISNRIVTSVFDSKRI